MSNLPDDSFRDTISTINAEGKRNFIHPKKPSGPFYDKRKLLSYLLLVFLIASPFIKIGGNQFLMFNVMERRFSIFGFAFWPQDFHLFVISMIVGVVGLTLFTVAFGRIFCGWFCPQTIFMEMVFRRIEYWIDGDRGAQLRLAKQEWNAEKIRKRVTKWTIFFIFSFFIANVFLAYLIGSDELIKLISSLKIENLIFLDEIEKPWISKHTSKRTDFKKLTKALEYFKLNKIWTKFNGGVLVSKLDWKPFLKHFYEITKCDSSFFFYNFIDKDQKIIFYIHYSGEINITTLNEEIDIEFLKQIKDTNFINSNRENTNQI